ncbi:hypothetical protein OUZ56_032540 [Daphnia magna]|uniref:Uncharacterized protein n=1 Tax=Daphnia magna TaxID=35525 RepID=A0ABR0B971_9CRUS|nr:hypothetical protein OUZ56_032540 [Daphnia magna]
MSASTFDDALRDLGAAPPLGRIDPLPSLRGRSPLADLPRSEWPRHYAAVGGRTFLDEVHRTSGPAEVFEVFVAADPVLRYRGLDAARFGGFAPWRALRQAACALPVAAREGWLARATGLSTVGRDDLFVAFEADRLLPADSPLRMLTAAPADLDALLGQFQSTLSDIQRTVCFDLFRRFGPEATRLLTSCWHGGPAEIRETVAAILPLNNREILAWAVRFLGLGADALLARYGNDHPTEMLAALRRIHPQQSPLFEGMYPIGTERRVAKKEAWIAELERRLAVAAIPVAAAAVGPGALSFLPAGRPVKWADDPWDPARDRSPLDVPSTRAWLGVICTQPTIAAALAAAEPLREAVLSARRDAEGLPALAADVFHGWMFREAPTRTKQVGPLGLVAAFGDAALVVEVGQYLLASAWMLDGDGFPAGNIFAQRQPLARRFLDALAGARRRLAVAGFAEVTVRAMAERPNQTGKYAQSLRRPRRQRRGPDAGAICDGIWRSSPRRTPPPPRCAAPPAPGAGDGRGARAPKPGPRLDLRGGSVSSEDGPFVDARPRPLWGRTLARRVLWASYQKRAVVPTFMTVTHGDEAYPAVFRVDESGAFVDLRERPFDITAATHIGLVPLAALNAEDQARAGDLFADYGIHPLLGFAP